MTAARFDKLPIDVYSLVQDWAYGKE